MKIINIKNSFVAELEQAGTVPVPVGTPVCLTSEINKTVPERNGVRAGVWECTPGSFRRSVSASEVMHILSGRAEFTSDDGQHLVFEAGDTIIMPPNTKGVWHVRETLRKVFVIV